MLGAILDRFAAEGPVSAMAQGPIEFALNASRLQEGPPRGLPGLRGAAARLLDQPYDKLHGVGPAVAREQVRRWAIEGASQELAATLSGEIAALC